MGARFSSSGDRNGDGVPARILDGKSLAAELRADLAARATALRERGIHPKLVIVFVGEDESSRAYVQALSRTGTQVGVDVVVDQLPAEATAAEIRARLNELRTDPAVHGVMIQQPLPPHLSMREIAAAIPPEKDVDGANPAGGAVPATPAAVMLLLERSPHWPLRGRRAVVVGRSNVVGKPVAMLMLAADASVTILHSKSGDLRPYLKDADVVVAASGVPGLIRGGDLKPGATVVDVGTTVVGGSLQGDVDFESALEIAGAITPVPGGVGPVTNVALLRNVVAAAERRE